MKPLYVSILVLFLISASLGQTEKSPNHPFSKTFVITGEGGLTLGDTDFPEAKTDYFGRGLIEYFFPTSSRSVFGLRLLAGGGFISGSGLSSSDIRYSGIDEFQTKIVYGGGGLVYSYSLGSVVQPYVSLNAAYLIFNPLRTDGTKLPRNAAAEYTKEEINIIGEFGLRFLISDYFSANLGFNFNYIDNDNIDDIWSSKNDIFTKYFGGISYYFRFSQDKDSDKDGVKDSKDICGNTPRGVEVDEFGCPVDNDNDGIADYLDECPDTPENVKVNSSGCPADSDDDGVADYLDKCPDTKPNAEVDEFGCEKVKAKKLIKEEIKKEEKKRPEIVTTPPKVKKETVKAEKIDKSFGSIVFNFGEKELLPDPKTGLDKLVSFMKSNPETKWVITGHTDRSGPDAVNRKLSSERANNILKYLLRRGISKDRLEVRFAGSDVPFGDNMLIFGRKLNRRVIIEERSIFENRVKKLNTAKSVDYNSSKEYNVESYIFTDGTFYCIQVSSWKRKNKAAQEVEKLKAGGHTAFMAEARPPHKSGTWYRVRIGYFDNLEGAREYQKRIP